MMYGVKSEHVASDSDESSEEEQSPQVTDDSIREDPDLLLVPTIVNKVVLPKLAGML